MADDSSDTEKGKVVGTCSYVTELGPHDVLLGRGTGPSNHEGNVNFRTAVEAMKADYVATPSRRAKNRLVRKTVEAIKSKKGRFLSKLRKSEMKVLGLKQKVAYEVVADSVAFEKTKQAIRYVHYKKDAHSRLKDSDGQVLNAKEGADSNMSPADPGRSLKQKKTTDQSGPILEQQPVGTALASNPAARYVAPTSVEQLRTLPHLAAGIPALSMQLQSLLGATTNPLLSGSLLPSMPILASHSMQTGLSTGAPIPSLLALQSSSQGSDGGSNQDSNATKKLAKSPTLSGAVGHLQASLAARNDAADILLLSRQLQTGSGQATTLHQENFQTALQNDHIRAMLLADESFRQFLTYQNLMNMPR